MALVGNIIATAFTGNPSIINYDMFVAVFAMLSLFYLIPATLRDSFIIHPFIMIVLDVLNTLFFFCGAVATAAKLGVHSCGNPVCISNRRYNEYLLKYFIGLYSAQRRNEWLARHFKTLPRSPSIHRIPLLWFCDIRRLCGSLSFPG
jgi:hypothetical protein